MIKLGILNTCTPQDEVEFGTEEFESFQTMFAQVDHHLDLVEYRVTEGDFPAVDACNAYLITGSPKGVYDDEPWIAQLGDFIRAAYVARRKLVGICFGHQMLAQALGGHAAKSEKGWGVGLHQVEIRQFQPWMEPALSRGAFYYCHQDQVMQLPVEAELVAGNNFCPNGMFVIGEQVLGLQAHPEFSEGVVVKAIDWVTETATDVNIAEAKATLSKGQPDNAIMAQWIVNFLAMPSN